MGAKDQDKDFTVKDKDLSFKDQDFKYVVKDSLRTRTTTLHVTTVKRDCKQYPTSYVNVVTVKWELTTDNNGRCQVNKISDVMCVWKQVLQKTTVNATKNTKNKDTTKDFSSRTRTSVSRKRT